MTPAPVARSADAEQGSGTAPGSPLSGRFNPEDNYKTFPHDGGHLQLRRALRSNPYNKVRQGRRADVGTGCDGTAMSAMVGPLNTPS